MKKTILFLFFLTISFSYGQSKDCNCNDIFDKDLRTYDSKFSRQDAKVHIYEYLLLSKKERKKKKKNFSFSKTLSAVVESIPLKEEIGLSYGSEKSSFTSIFQETIKNSYLSDEHLNILLKSYIPTAGFKSYEKCLEHCNILNQSKSNGGVTLKNLSQIDDIIVLELKFISKPSGHSITLDNATITNGSIIGLKQFRKGRILNDGQTIIEQIKINPNETFSIAVNFKEPGVSASYLVPKQEIKERKNTDSPIGTIVASLLEYNQFLKLNGLENTGDMSEAIWVPCDGRDIGTEKFTYGAYSGGKAPDLRGLFLRGANDMGSTFTTPEPNTDNLNPDNTKVGLTQLDAIASHKHKINTRGNGQHSGGRGFVATSDNKNNHKGFKAITDEQENGKTETRPKNMTVYYYIKIR